MIGRRAVLKLLALAGVAWPGSMADAAEPEEVTRAGDRTRRFGRQQVRIARRRAGVEIVIVHDPALRHPAVYEARGKALEEITSRLPIEWVPKMLGAERGQRIRFTAFIMDAEGRLALAGDRLPIEVISARVRTVVRLSAAPL
jgi:hypothetical protein